MSLLKSPNYDAANIMWFTVIEFVKQAENFISFPQLVF